MVTKKTKNGKAGKKVKSLSVRSLNAGRAKAGQRGAGSRGSQWTDIQLKRGY